MSPLTGLFLLVFLAKASLSDQTGNLPHSCRSHIYCQDELLRDVQLANIFMDSKTFVDKKLRYKPNEILDSYKELKKKYGGDVPPKEELESFVEDNFEEGNELVDWEPEDWTPEPSLLARVRDPELRNWTRNLNEIWKNLSRRMDPKVKENQDLYSLIYVPNGFIIPGGRFKELYYWDTYWIVNGILLCDMTETARGVIENLLYLLRTIGHIPNGSRVYYLERSQPPMLTLMVESYFKKTGDFKFVKKNIQLLDEEMEFWINNRTIEVKKGSRTYKLFRYNAPSKGPRPESYREDFETALTASSKEDRQVVYTALKSGAESGWDFSTRWMIYQATNGGNLSNIHTPDIVPVDLNALMYGNFKILEEWYTILKNETQMKKYQSRSKELLKGINNVLWNEEENIWLDYDCKNKVSRKYFYMSNFVPLWTKAHTFNPQRVTKIVMKYINKHNITQFVGGTPTSLINSGEQWDFPNAWPPLQAFFIQGLDRIGTPEAEEVAFLFAEIYLRSNYAGYRNFDAMYEKYDALSVGRTGGGGEYDAQTGFGWTNGFALQLEDRWGHRFTATDNQLAETEQLTQLVSRFS